MRRQVIGKMLLQRVKSLVQAIYLPTEASVGVEEGTNVA